VVVCGKKLHHCLPEQIETGDCWIALSLVQLNGLILSGRVGKHTDSLAIELVTSTEGKTDCKEWQTDGWGGYERVFGDEVEHYISKALTQRLERTNGILRQQTGRWHRQQNKFGKVWELSESYLAFSYHLLQLDLDTFPFRNYGSSTSRLNLRTLGLARYCCLFHACLTHNRL
jgi:IS1 family transposase